MNLKFYTLDVFSDKVFGGNPLAIFPEADLLSVDVMQSIASEINYSETVFIQKPVSEKNSAKVKIFTPKNELPFAGHPNVGAGYFLIQHPQFIQGYYSKEKMIFEELAGLVYVSPQYDGQNVIGAEIEAPSKFNTSISIPSSVISRCIEIDEKFLVDDDDPPVVAGVGLDFVIAEVESYEILKKARCNISAFEEADKDYSYGDDFFSLMIFTNNVGKNIVARVFAPLSGIVEDAATGSACGALGALLAFRNNMLTGKIDFEIHQGESIGRPSYINVSVIKEKGEVIKTSISGKCVLVSEGTFYI